MAGVMALAAGVACGDDDDDDSSGGAACDAYRDVVSKVEELRSMNILTEGTDKLRQRAEGIRDSLETLRKEAKKGTTADEVKAAEDAVSDLRTTVSTFKVSDGLNGATNVATAIKAAVDSFNTVRQTFKNDCK
jgi:uncharacterized protein YoxC